MARADSWTQMFGDLRHMLTQAEDSEHFRARMTHWVDRAIRHDAARYRSEAVPYLQSFWSRSAVPLAYPFEYRSYKRSHKELVAFLERMPFAKLRVSIWTEKCKRLLHDAELRACILGLRFELDDSSYDARYAEIFGQEDWEELEELDLLLVSRQGEPQLSIWWEVLSRPSLCPKLRTLRWGGEIPCAQFAAWLASPERESVRGLELRYVTWSRGHAEAFGASVLAHNLTRLSLTTKVFAPVMEDVFDGARFEALRDLEIKNWSSRPEMVRRALCGVELSELGRLAVVQCGWDDSDVMWLATQAFSTLRELDLSGHRFGQHVWRELCTNESLCGVNKLWLSVQPEDLYLIEELEAFSGLQELYLTNYSRGDMSHAQFQEISSRYGWRYDESCKGFVRADA